MARHKSRKSRKEAEIGYGQIAVWAVMAFAITWYAVPEVQSFYALAIMSEEERTAIETSVHYPGCDNVRMLGKAPLYRGQPGYRAGMDGDGDGIACESY